MNRREAIARVSLLVGGTIVGAEAFLSGCSPQAAAVSTSEFTAATLRFLDEVGETILPETPGLPGAKAVQIGEFMKIIVSECYDAEDQAIFMAGIGKIEEAAKARSGGKAFLDLDAGTRTALLQEIDTEAKAQDKANRGQPDAPKHYFSLMKQLTLWGYFTSEPGANQALRYLEVPGPYQGCIPYEEGQRAWAI
jgi:hypothetical protein